MAKSDDYTKSSDKRPRSTSRSTVQVPLHFTIHKPGCHVESCCGVCNLFPGVLLIAFAQVLVGSILLTLILTHGKQYDEMHQTPTSQIISMASGAVLTGVTGAGVLLIIVALTENCRAMLVYLLVASLVWMGIMSLALGKIGRSCIRFRDAPKTKDEHHRLANLACVSGLFTFLGAGSIPSVITTVAGLLPGSLCESDLPTAVIGRYLSPLWAGHALCGSGMMFLYRRICMESDVVSRYKAAVLYLFSFVVVLSFYHFRYVRRAILLHEAECE